VIFDDLTPRKVIAGLLPDVLVKGGDWPGDKIVGRGGSGKKLPAGAWSPFTVVAPAIRQPPFLQKITRRLRREASA